MLPERRVAAGKRLLCLLPVLSASHPRGTPVLQALLLSRCTCKRLRAGRRPKSSWSGTSWRAKIRGCCSAQTLDESSSRCRCRACWARKEAAWGFLKRRKPLVVLPRHSVLFPYTRNLFRNSCDGRMKIDVLMGFAETLIKDKDIKTVSLGKAVVHRPMLTFF